VHKFKHLVVPNKKEKSSKPVDKQKSRSDDLRKELGTNLDGSLGVYAGKRYEGLGSNDVLAYL
jgi:hypothetical protein